MLVVPHGWLTRFYGAYANSPTLGGRKRPGKAVSWAANALIECQLSG